VIPTLSFILTFLGGLVTHEIGPGSWIIVDNIQLSRPLILFSKLERIKEQEIMNTQISKIFSVNFKVGELISNVSFANYVKPS